MQRPVVTKGTGPLPRDARGGSRQFQGSHKDSGSVLKVGPKSHVSVAGGEQCRPEGWSRRPRRPPRGLRRHRVCRRVETEFLISVGVQFLSTAAPASPLTVRGSEVPVPLAKWDLVAVVPSALSWRPSRGGPASAVCSGAQSGLTAVGNVCQPRCCPPAEF